MSSSVDLTQVRKEARRIRNAHWFEIFYVVMFGLYSSFAVTWGTMNGDVLGVLTGAGILVITTHFALSCDTIRADIAESKVLRSIFKQEEAAYLDQFQKHLDQFRKHGGTSE